MRISNAYTFAQAISHFMFSIVNVSNAVSFPTITVATNNCINSARFVVVAAASDVISGFWISGCKIVFSPSESVASACVPVSTKVIALSFDESVTTRCS